MYERDQENYDRPQRSYRPDRDSASKLEKIKREVKSWFDDDDDDAGRDYRDRQADDYTTERSQRRQNYYSGDSRPSQYYDDDREGSGNLNTARDVYQGSDGENYRRPETRQAEPEYVRYGNDYYLRDRGAGYGFTSTGPVRYAYASFFRVPGPYAGTGPKGYKRSSDGLKEQVCERLENDGRINASEIEVDVKDCEVTLKGKVPSREQKRCAEDCADSVDGIADVHNRLTIDQNMETQSGNQPGYRDSVPTSDNFQSGNAESQGSKAKRTARK
jgi:hypothetical protein